jgi:hypothetical protein
MIKKYSGTRSCVVPWQRARCKKRFVSSVINASCLLFTWGISYLSSTNGLHDGSWLPEITRDAIVKEKITQDARPTKPIPGGRSSLHTNARLERVISDLEHF